MKLFRIKWENILTIIMFLSMTLCWIVFFITPDIYSLALAIIPTFMTLIMIMLYGSIKEARILLQK